MDKLQLTGQNLSRVFNFRNGRVHAAHFLHYRVKLPILKFKIWRKQLNGSLPLDITLRGFRVQDSTPLNWSVNVSKFTQGIDYRR